MPKDCRGGWITLWAVREPKRKGSDVACSSWTKRKGRNKYESKQFLRKIKMKFRANLFQQQNRVIVVLELSFRLGVKQKF
jgi:hypothetical protein